MNESRQVSEVDSNPSKRWAGNYFLVEVCNVTYKVKKFCQMELWVAHSCPTLCSLTDCNPPGPSVKGVFQARILEWAAISSSRCSSWRRGQTYVSCMACVDGHILYHWATQETLISCVPNSKYIASPRGNMVTLLTYVLWSCSILS